MAAVITDGTTDRIVYTSEASIDDLTAWTVLLWVRWTTLDISFRRIYSKDTGGVDGFRNIFLFGSPSEYFMRVDRATTRTNYSGGSPSTGGWSYVVFTYDESQTTPDKHKLYEGDLTTLVSRTTLGTTSDGAGAQLDDAGADIFIGAFNAATSNATGAEYAVIGHWDRELSLGEIQAQQFAPHATAGGVILGHPGWTGLTSVTDLSGNNLPGTFGGTIELADHVPLGPPFGYDPEWAAEFIAVPPFPPFLMRHLKTPIYRK